jgi:hypothetical protein
LLQVLGMGSEREQFDIGQTNEESRFGRTLAENTRQFDVGQANEESRFGRQLNENRYQFDTSEFNENERFNKNLEQQKTQFETNLKETTRQFDLNHAQQGAIAEAQNRLQYAQLHQAGSQFDQNLAFQKEQAALSTELQRQGMSASAASAAAAQSLQQQQFNENNRRYDAQNPPELQELRARVEREQLEAALRAIGLGA